jgi:hypothetical protein
VGRPAEMENTNPGFVLEPSSFQSLLIVGDSQSSEVSCR